MGTVCNGSVNTMIESDVLVIGGGLGGCRAALRAKDFTQNVVLVDKGIVGRTGNTIPCHIILAPTPQESLDDWVRESVEFSEYTANETWFKTLFCEQPKRLRELEEWGVTFIKDSQGNLLSERCRGMMEACKSAVFGERFWMDHVRKQLISQGVKLVPRIMITELLTSDGEYPTSGRVTGAVGFNIVDGQCFIFKARAVVIATGPISSVIHARSSNMTGDGHAMAFRAGAEITNMEFASMVNFMAMLKPPSNVLIRSLAQFQNHGAHFINALGERFIGNYFPNRMEQGSGFTHLGLACAREILDGHGPLFFDMRHWSHDMEQMMRRSAPEMMAILDKAGINILKQPVEFKLIVDWFSPHGNGGIDSTIDGETSIPGLFASGVSANAGAGEVFAGVAQAACNVFGYRAGESAGQEALKRQEATISHTSIRQLFQDIKAPLRRDTNISATQVYHAIASKTLPHRYSLYKHKLRIMEALAELDRIEVEMLPRVSAADPHGLVKANTVRNYLQVSRLSQLASLERKESRSHHYREDYPYRDDINWLKWLIFKQGSGKITVRTDPIPIDQYQHFPRDRVMVPAQVCFSTQDPTA